MPRGGLQGIGHIPYERDDYWRQCSNYLGYECLTKSDVYKLLGYIPVPTIEQLHRSRATHRILKGGNRSGKTYGGMMEVVPYLFWLNTCGWVVSATYDLAEELRRKIEDILIERAGMEKAVRPDQLQPWQFCYNMNTHTFTMGTGSWFQLKSAEAPDSMHAQPIDWVLIDEAALCPYMIYDTRLVPRLVDSGGWIMSMGTVELLTGEWFEEYFDVGQTQNEMGIASWEHPTEDNFHLFTAKGGETPEQVGEVYHTNWKKIVETNHNIKWPLSPGDQVIIWNIDYKWLMEQKKRMDPAVFSARFEAKSFSNPYVVFPTWSLKDHVNADRAKFDKELPVYLAVDPGGTYAVAAVQFKKFNDVGQSNELTRGYSMCIIDELYFQTTITTHEVFDVVSQRPWWGNVGRWAVPSWDPVQGAIDVTALEQQRVWTHLARKDDTVKSLHLMSRKVLQQAGIQTLQHFLDTGSIYVHPKCTFWNLEMRRWTYPQPSLSGVGTEDPRKKEPKDAWNHLTKAVIYLVVNKYGYFGRSQQSAKSSPRDARNKRKDDRAALARSVTSRFVR